MTFFVVIVVGSLTRACLGSESAVSWHTDAAFRRALSNRVDLYWSDTPLRGALERLAGRQQVAILLDRRLDPDRRIEFAAEDMPFEQLLVRLAAGFDATPSFIGSVVYIGPRAATANLSVVAAHRREECRLLPRQVASRLQAERRWQWDQLAEPRELIRQLADQARISIDSLELIPHDLWPAVDLPALPWTDRLTLVLAGFDLTFEFVDNSRLRLVPLPRPELIERSHSLARSSVSLQLVNEVFPDAEIDAAGRRIKLRGTIEEQGVLERMLRERVTERPSDPSEDRTLYTLKVTNQLAGAILKTLEQRSGLKFVYGPNVDRQLYKRVTVDASEVTLNDLLDKTLSPAGLTHRRVGDTITISVE